MKVWIHFGITMITAFSPGAMAASPIGGGCDVDPLPAPGLLQGEGFGSSADLCGDVAIVGSPGNSALTGRVFVYERGGAAWTLQQELEGPTGGVGDSFGSSVGVDGDTLVVGAPRDRVGSSFPGSAQVFVRSGSTWSHQAELLSTAACGNGGVCFFGTDVDVSGDTVVVGQNPTERAFVFDRSGTTWTLTTELFSSIPATGDEFGVSVAIDGDTIAVGAYVPFQPQPAYVTVFVRTGGAWSEQARLFASDPLSTSYLGRSLALSGDTIAAGGWISDVAYVWERSGTSWSPGFKLQPFGADLDFRFGDTLDLDGDLLAVGSPFESSAVQRAGALYVYARGAAGWNQLAKLAACTPTVDGHFGDAVALEGERLVIGSVEGQFFQGTGTADTVDLPLAPEAYCVGKPNSLGCVPFLTTTGTARTSTSAGPFIVFANDVLPNEAGFLLYGAKKANLNFHGGKLCIKAPLTRILPPRIAKAVGSPPCTGVLDQGMNKRIQSGVDPQLTPGAQVHAQWRQRDNADPAGFGDSLTDAVSFAIYP